jgi:integrase
LALAISQAPDPIADWLTLAAYAGLRACEISRLRGEDLDRDNAVLRIPEGKGGHPRTVPAHRLILACAERWPASGPPWLSAKGEAYKPNNVCHRTSIYLREIGVAATLHKFRHRFGTRCYVASGDILETKELLGHKQLNTVLAYVALVNPGGRDTIDAL